MTCARHRLFDAKRRDGWHTYMQGAELASQWHGRVPVYANDDRIPGAWITNIQTAKSWSPGTAPIISFRSN